MQVGSLVECVANNITNPDWKGTKPVIGLTYTIRHFILIQIRLVT